MFYSFFACILLLNHRYICLKMGGKLKLRFPQNYCTEKITKNPFSVEPKRLRIRHQKYPKSTSYDSIGRMSKKYSTKNIYEFQHSICCFFIGIKTCLELWWCYFTPLQFFNKSEFPQITFQSLSSPFSQWISSPAYSLEWSLINGAANWRTRFQCAEWAFVCHSFSGSVFLTVTKQTILTQKLPCVRKTCLQVQPKMVEFRPAVHQIFNAL